MTDKEEEVIEQVDKMLETIKSIMNSLSSIDRKMNELQLECNDFSGVFKKTFSTRYEDPDNVNKNFNKFTVH